MNIKYGHDWDGQLEEWLAFMATQNPYRADADVGQCTWSFPTDELLKEYLADIGKRPEKEVFHLLRCFLFEDVTFSSDVQLLRVSFPLLETKSKLKFLSTEYGRRLIRPATAAHPGIRWILDLLPAFPQRALDVISAYISAHVALLPDGRLEGLWDATALISARYMTRRSENGTEALKNISPRELEQITARLYTRMGYACVLTPATNDGGRDVVARRDLSGRREHRVIDCAKYAGSVPITKARAILGTADHQHATSAVLLTTGRISKKTREMAAHNSKLDLVDGKQFIELLDTHLGHDWPQLIDYWIQWPPRD